MNGGDLASHVCVQTEAGGAWGLQEGHVGAELTITYKMMPVGFSLQRYNLPSSFFFFPAFSTHDSGKQNSQELFGIF